MIELRNSIKANLTSYASIMSHDDQEFNIDRVASIPVRNLKAIDTKVRELKMQAQIMNSARKRDINPDRIIDMYQTVKEIKKELRPLFS